jgi:hypothetical protein
MKLTPRKAHAYFAAIINPTVNRTSRIMKAVYRSGTCGEYVSSDFIIGRMAVVYDK